MGRELLGFYGGRRGRSCAGFGAGEMGQETQLLPYELKCRSNVACWVCMVGGGGGFARGLEGWVCSGVGRGRSEAGSMAGREETRFLHCAPLLGSSAPVGMTSGGGRRGPRRLAGMLAHTRPTERLGREAEACPTRWSVRQGGVRGWVGRGVW